MYVNTMYVTVRDEPAPPLYLSNMYVSLCDSYVCSQLSTIFQKRDQKTFLNEPPIMNDNVKNASKYTLWKTLTLVSGYSHFISKAEGTVSDLISIY